MIFVIACHEKDRAANGRVRAEFPLQHGFDLRHGACEELGETGLLGVSFEPPLGRLVELRRIRKTAQVSGD